jgi:hypothetical protein
VVQGLVPSELSPPRQIAHGLARARVRRRKNARHSPLIKELLTATTLDTSSCLEKKQLSERKESD